MSSTVWCRCGHSLLSHVERYEEVTDGTWCVQCDCGRFRRAWLDRFRRRPRA